MVATLPPPAVEAYSALDMAGGRVRWSEEERKALTITPEHFARLPLVLDAMFAIALEDKAYRVVDRDGNEEVVAICKPADRIGAARTLAVYNHRLADALRAPDKAAPTHQHNTQLNINFRPNPGDEELLPKVAAMLGIELPQPERTPP